jgi:hypothetical protein
MVRHFQLFEVFIINFVFVFISVAVKMIPRIFNKAEATTPALGTQSVNGTSKIVIRK